MSDDASGEKTPKMATVRQAKRLKQLGFVWREGKKRRKLSLKGIQEKLSLEQAGVIIRSMEMKGKTKTGKESWLIEYPARAFLNEDEAHNLRHLSQQINQHLDQAIHS